MVEHIEIKVPNGVKLDNFFVFLSEDTISSSQSISEIVENQDISRLFIEKEEEGEITLNKSGRYLRIQKNGLTILEIGNIIIWGHLGELCGNGVDDDSDGKIDCDDSDCSAEIINVAVVQQPTCNICSDGVISVQEVALNSSRREINLDGGVIFSPMPNPYQQFSGLSPGDYNIIIRNKSFGCLTPWAGGTIELRAPQGQPLGHCENGDLESGDFTGWKGYTTLWVKENGIPAPPFVGVFEEGFVDIRHRIVSAGVDPFAPLIHYPFSGDYSFLLGNSNNGYNIDKTTYSFVVDDDNKDFTFNYAAVVQDPSDHEDFKPYFEYAFYYLDNGIKHLILGSDFKVIADRDNPYWSVGHGLDVVYRGWSCVNIDLSDYLGKEIEVEFIVADCGYNVHFGYVYIDGLCVSSDDNMPIPSLEINEIVCESQGVYIDATKSISFNKYDLKICELDGSSNPVNCIQTTEYASFIPIIDVEKYFVDNSMELVCGKNYSVSLTLHNDCSSPESIERKFRYECGGASISYKDFLMCSNDPTYNTPIDGDVDCSSCDYEWSPSSKLQNSSSAFPIISRDTDWDAYQYDYTVKVKDDLGCIYRDTVEFYHLPILEIEALDLCGLEFSATVFSERPISGINNLYDINFYNESTDGQLDIFSASGNFSSDRTEFIYSFNHDQMEVGESILGTVGWAYQMVNNTDEFSVIAPNVCPVTKSIFTMNENDFPVGEFAFFFRSAFDPFSYHPLDHATGPLALHSNASIAKFQIWDVSGGLVHEKIIGEGIAEVNIKELEWDGYWRGQLMNPAVFAYVLTLSNCTYPDGKLYSGGITLCFGCVKTE